MIIGRWIGRDVEGSSRAHIRCAVPGFAATVTKPQPKWVTFFGLWDEIWTRGIPNLKRWYRRSFCVKSTINRGCCYCHVTAGMAGGSPLSDRATVLKTEKLPSIPDQGKRFFFPLRRNQLPGSRSLYTGYRWLVSWGRGGELKWTGRVLTIIVLPRSRTRGVVPPPPYTSL